MKDTKEVAALVAKAKSRLAEDMQRREIGAIIWNIAETGFHYIPEIVIDDPRDEKERTVRVTGLYLYKGELYAMEEGAKGFNIRHYYTPGVDVPPSVVTLTPSVAEETFGKPSEEHGYTQEGTPEEWLVVADCYFEALNEK